MKVAVGQAKVALRRGLLVKENKHYRYYQASRRLFSAETVKRILEQADRVEALKGNDQNTQA